ncbi:hypothetical protein B0H17DRAFT_1198700 [Mycena rosella]|uniref:Uncharacterized protein n=1 Tax=Mycena rosella TaxID=1033263 RepID=A0AAD7DNP4_MYCRO|nr:hypothetical protein B0H17DRAFT_1198700 [Mycena rosella]
MFPSSPSESSGLNRKRELDDSDVELLFASFMELVWREPSVQQIPGGRKEWTKVKQKILRENKTVPKLSRPFTESKSFYEELFDEYSSTISLPRNDPKVPPPKDQYQEAADALQNNPLWDTVKVHVVMNSETSCRTAIDMVVLTAVNLAQQEIGKKPAVDNALRERHVLKDAKCRVDGYPHKIGSWIVLHQEVEIPDQDVRRGLAVHGIIDYLIGVTPAKRVKDQMRDHRFLSQGFSGDIRHSMATLAEAKARLTLTAEKARAQVLVQGAAVCVMTQRRSVVNILTDGFDWIFFVISKRPNRKKLNSKLAKGSIQKRLNATKKPAEAPKPFKASMTCSLNVLVPGDLAIILRLLKTAIISDATSFESLASEGA